MLFAVVCSFGTGGLASAAAPPAIVSPGFRVVPGPGSGRLSPPGFSRRDPLTDPETIRRDLLEQTRKLRRLLEDEIKMYERMAAEADALSDPERYDPYYAQANAEFARDFRRDAAKFRQELPRVKQRERRLWEEQPGGITAPAPRPVKRGD